MNIKSIFKFIAIVLTVVEFVLTIVYTVMTFNEINEEVMADQPVAEVVTMKPYGVADILNEENILAPIEACDNNPRACRWAQGKHNNYRRCEKYVDPRS